MDSHILGQQPKKMTLQAVVTRADGTVEDLGVIAETSFEGAPSPATVLRDVLLLVNQVFPQVPDRPAAFFLVDGVLHLQIPRNGQFTLVRFGDETIDLPLLQSIKAQLDEQETRD